MFPVLWVFAGGSGWDVLHRYMAHHLSAAGPGLELEKPGFKKQDKQAVMMLLLEFSDKPLFSAQPEKPW